MNLELELIEVKESLKKALSGGVTLGLTIEPKTSSSAVQVSRSYVHMEGAYVGVESYTSNTYTQESFNRALNVGWFSSRNNFGFRVITTTNHSLATQMKSWASTNF